MKPTILFAGAKTIGANCLKEVVKLHTAGTAELIGVVRGQPRNTSLTTGQSVDDIAEQAAVPVYADWPTAAKPNFIVSVQYQSVLSAEQLAQAETSAVNLHLAPLPEYRGANQFSYAILNGDTEFGVTLHEMVPRVDAGPVLGERRFAIAPACVVSELYDTACEEAVILFRETLGPLLRGELQPREQATDEPGVVTHFYRKKDIESEKRLDPSWSPEKIDRYVRAMDMPGYEPPFFEIDGRKIYLSLRWR